jgi:hypothetical protein
MQPMGKSLCGAIATHFKLPNFCKCNEAPLGGELTCSVGLGNIISIGASGFIYPCASPASVGYKAWVISPLFGINKVISQWPSPV